MNYTFVTDSIEVRGLKENDKPRYIVNGIAILANKKHIYEYLKNKDGSVKTLKNIFTPHCIQSIKEQAKHKSLFVDIQHELVREASIKALAKEKGYSEEEMKQLDNMLKRKRLPLAKLNDIDIEGDKMGIYTELNPMFRELDEEHKNYFDVVWYSLQNKFLNGISPNFGEFKYAYDEQGDLVIDDVDILGFSYVDAAAGHEHSITEVAIRALQEGTNIRGEKEMEDEKKQLEIEKKNLENERIKYNKDKEELEIEKSRLQKMAEEETKKAELAKQEEEQKKIQKELEEKTELAKENAKLKEELNHAKGVVGQQPPPANAGKVVADAKFFEENIKKITAKHDATIQTYKQGKQPLIDETFSGFSEMVNLQAKAGNLTADLDEKNADFIKEHRLLDKGKSDLVIMRPTGK